MNSRVILLVFLALLPATRICVAKPPPTLTQLAVTQSPDDLTEKLSQLKQLRDQNQISDQEYQGARKTAIDGFAADRSSLTSHDLSGKLSQLKQLRDQNQISDQEHQDARKKAIDGFAAYHSPYTSSDLSFMFSQLKQLRDQNQISDQEYQDAKKKAIDGFAAYPSPYTLSELSFMFSQLKQLRDQNQISDQEHQDARKKAIDGFAVSSPENDRLPPPPPPPNFDDESPTKQLKHTEKARPAPRLAQLAPTPKSEEASSFVRLITVPLTSGVLHPPTEIFVENTHKSRIIGVTVANNGVPNTPVFTLHPGERVYVCIGCRASIRGAWFQ